MRRLFGDIGTKNIIVIGAYSLTDSRVEAAEVESDAAAVAADLDVELLPPLLLLLLLLLWLWLWLLLAAGGEDSVSEATLPEWLFRLYQSATMPLSVDWLEH